MRRGWIFGALAVATLSTAACADSLAGPADLDVDAIELAAGADLAAAGPVRDGLALTDAQKAAIRAIVDELKAANKPLVEQFRAAEKRSEARRAIAKQIRTNAEAARAKILAVLTAEQRAKLEELRAKHPLRPTRPGRRG